MARMARTRARGFTLIELLVSLTAGLIIAIAVAGLAKTATTTFYEESRVQVAELSLRVAVDRLRGDLSRAAYMSTPNLLTDPLVVLPLGAATVAVPPEFANGLGLLAGVRYLPDSVHPNDNGANIATLSSANLGAGVLPDRLIIGGNLTTADEYIVQSVLPGGACNGMAVTLSPDSPAISRLIRDATGALLPGATATIALNDAFAPINPTGTTQYMARLVDDTGRRQFAVLCPVPAAMVANVPVISLSPAVPIVTANASGAQGGASGFGVGRLTINPVQLVEWSLRDRTATAPASGWARDPSPDAGTRFDLVREFLDATGARVGIPELIAEYVVDFEIGLVVETPGAVPRMQLVPFDTPTSTLVTQSAMTPAATTPLLGPQWIRSLRYRMATRAPMADRTTTIPNGGGLGYAYRYCTDLAGCDTSQRFARVRTLTGEVALANQSRFP